MISPYDKMAATLKTENSTFSPKKTSLFSENTLEAKEITFMRNRFLLEARYTQQEISAKSPFEIKLQLFQKLFFLSTFIEWNGLDPGHLRTVFNCYDPDGVILTKFPRYSKSSM